MTLLARHGETMEQSVNVQSPAGKGNLYYLNGQLIPVPSNTS